MNHSTTLAYTTQGVGVSLYVTVVRPTSSDKEDATTAIRSTRLNTLETRQEH